MINHCIYFTGMKYLFLFITLFERSTKGRRFPADAIANISIGVTQKFYSSYCVYFLQDWNTSQQSSLNIYDSRILNSLRLLQTVPQMVIKMDNHANKTFLLNDLNKLQFVLINEEGQTQYKLRQLSRMNGLRTGKWLLFLESTMTLEEIFTDTYISMDCEFIVAQYSTETTDRKSSVLFHEVYHVHPSGRLHIHLIANWTRDGGFTWTNTPYHARRGNLDHATMRAAFVQTNRITTLVRNHGNESEILTGYEGEISNELEIRLNFKYELYEPADRKYGDVLKDESWSGMIGMMLRNEVAIGIGRFDFTEDRLQVVHYLPPINDGKTKLFIKQPTLADSNINHILSPFTIQIWLLVIIVMIVLTTNIATIWYFHGCYAFRRSQEEVYALYDSVIHVFGVFCCQGVAAIPRARSYHLVYLTANVTALVIFIAYSAVFISFLNVRRFHLPFTDFESLLLDGSYMIGVMPGTLSENYFENSSNRILQQVYQKLIGPHKRNFPYYPVESLRRLCNAKRAGYITPQMLVREVAHMLPCRLVDVPRTTIPVAASLVINKGNPYRRLFTHHITQMRETGILKRIYNTFIPPDFEEILEDTFSSVTLETVNIFFIVLEIGVLSSVIILISEKLVHALRVHVRNARRKSIF